MREKVFIMLASVIFFQTDAMNRVLVKYTEEQKQEIAQLFCDCHFETVKERIIAINAANLDDEHLLLSVSEAYNALSASKTLSGVKRKNSTIDHRVRNELRTAEVSLVHSLLKICEPLRGRLDAIASGESVNKERASYLVQQLYVQ